jgi:hypothetical protein
MKFDAAHLNFQRTRSTFSDARMLANSAIADGWKRKVR